MIKWVVDQGNCSESGLLQVAFRKFESDLNYYANIFFTQFYIFVILFGLVTCFFLALIFVWVCRLTCECISDSI